MAPAAPAAAPAVAQPAPPPQPTQADKVQVAALDAAALKLAKPQPLEDQTADDDKIAMVAAPLPPRRPSDLPMLASLTPLPPARPTELTVLAYAGSAPVLRRDPIADVIGESGRKGGVQSGGVQMAMRSAEYPPLPPSRAELVPARLDRSNFRAMTGSQPATRMTTQTVLGPALSAPRSAARAQSGVLINKPEASPGRFGAKASELPTTRFSQAARQRADLATKN
jgi:hypothetical protein